MKNENLFGSLSRRDLLKLTAAGVTGVARSVGASLSPSIAAVLVASPAWMGAPFFLAGGVKIAYDLLLYRWFSALRPAEEASSRER